MAELARRVEEMNRIKQLSMDIIAGMISYDSLTLGDRHMAERNMYTYYQLAAQYQERATMMLRTAEAIRKSMGKEAFSQELIDIALKPKDKAQ